MAKTLANKGLQRESDASDSSALSRPIHTEETDAFVERLKDTIADKKIVWFAEECGLPESNIRAYLNGRLPSIEKAVAIADAGGVTLDWLAAGRPPKTRAEQRALAAAARPAPGEAELLAVWRSAGPAGRHALAQLAAALRSPSAPAWLAAGQAIAEAARLADPPPAHD